MQIRIKYFDSLIQNIEQEINSLDKTIQYIPQEELKKDLIGHKSRNPLVYKLYRVLKYKPILGINEIIAESLE